MNSNLLAELESIGYELRVVDSHCSVVNQAGDEVVRLPLDVLDRAGEAGAPRFTERGHVVLPADLLNWKD